MEKKSNPCSSFLRVPPNHTDHVVDPRSKFLPETSQVEGGGNNFIPVFPSGPEDKPWAPATTGHIDGYNTAWRGTGHHRACITLYLNEVEEGQGCFTVWKGGARRIHRFFRDHPAQLDGHFYDAPFFKDRGWNALHDEGGRLEVAPQGMQFVGKPGDCILWHGS